MVELLTYYLLGGGNYYTAFPIGFNPNVEDPSKRIYDNKPLELL